MRSPTFPTVRARTRGHVLAAAIACAAGLGCPGSLSDPAAFEDAGTEAAVTPACSAATVPAAIFTPTCAISGCHSATTQAAALDLESPGARSRLSGKAASGGPGVLIDPGGDPTKSVLYLVLESSPPFGAQMPLTGTKLDAAGLSCVAAWISTGATDATPPAESSVPEAGATDASVDGGHDAGVDATVHDASPDGPKDAPVDVAKDAPKDAPPDAPKEAAGAHDASDGG